MHGRNRRRVVLRGDFRPSLAAGPPAKTFPGLTVVGARAGRCFGFAVINSVPGNVKLYSYEDLRIATEDFSIMNKVGNRGFEPVYKGTLVNGIKVAIKVLSSESTQGAKEFLSEIAAISDIVHENLVKLYGACIKGDYRILVYNYLKNNSLTQTLLVPQ
ncbi:putative LRR receptor-like serine/threonine-protein kinase [Platanthera zijinensis]|uniref:LRR receptor-like serine/threonine-protein kinase n=1 Tax=Platanthera zijinensis TaxID=2320716 RepID=A0AAP0GFL5_9ASPA